MVQKKIDNVPMCKKKMINSPGSSIDVACSVSRMRHTPSADPAPKCDTSAVDPRKLDSEKCQVCRQHKLKPRTWPQKCDRCVSKGLECSPGEVKRRARRPAAVTQEGSEGAVAAVATSCAPVVSTHSNYEARRETWDVEDVMNILTVVQLLNSEYEIHHSQRAVHTRIFKSPWPHRRLEVPHVSSLHLSLPLLKDKLSIALKTRLGGGAPCPAERIVLETALVDLHGDLPRRPTTTAAASRDGGEPPRWAQLRDSLFRSRAAPVGSETAGLRRLARLAGGMYSEDLMRRFGLREWSHVEQGFGREWAHLLPCSILGPLLFDGGGGGGEHHRYREPRCHLKTWVHDVAARSGAGLGLAPRDFAAIPGARAWTLDHLAFLTAAVGIDDEDNQGLSLVHAAILDRRPDVVRQLMARGANAPRRIRGRRFSLFHFAAAVGCAECYLELRSHLAPAEEEEVRDWNGMLPLHVAALHGHARVVEAILSANRHDADYVNRETHGSGWTPLSLAIAHPEAGDAAELLARYPGVRFVGVCDTGQTALHVAASRGRRALFRSLLAVAPGALVNARTGDGETPLHILARRGDREAMEAALGVPGVDADAAAGDGATPLTYAVVEARLDAVKMLAARGDVDVGALRRPVGPLDVSPLDYAKREAESKDAGREYVKVLEFLRGRFDELGENFDECSDSHLYEALFFTD
ncbi:ankyrin [Colletotrichum falcatum]|nr:ankyrin [Colletotrichum falcatum]